jgi:hypothetical protein
MKYYGHDACNFQICKQADPSRDTLDVPDVGAVLAWSLAADPGEPLFRQVLDQYFGGVPDSATEQRS